MVCEYLLNGNGLQREDDVSERIVLELVSLNAIENDGTWPLLPFRGISGIGLCVKFDLAGLAMHLVRNDEVIM
jgi:hypothetical protein